MQLVEGGLVGHVFGRRKGQAEGDALPRGGSVETHGFDRVALLDADVRDGFDGVGYGPLVAEFAAQREGLGEIRARGLVVVLGDADLAQDSTR